MKEREQVLAGLLLTRTALWTRTSTRPKRSRLPHRQREPGVCAAMTRPSGVSAQGKLSKRGSGSLAVEHQTADHEIEADTAPTLPLQAWCDNSARWVPLLWHCLEHRATRHR
jgi:hypothetical protein